MTIDKIKKEIKETASKFSFVKSVRLLDETDSAVKFRLEIDNLTFIQIYQNISYGTINYVLVRSFMRVYGRDCCDGTWHRHPFEDPSSYDFSIDGSEIVSLFDFLLEVEEYLIEQGLI